MALRIVLLVLIQWLLSFALTAKDNRGIPPRNRGWNFSPHYGYIVPHTSQMVHLIQGHAYGFFTSYYKPVNNTKMWHSAYNFPEQGVDFGYINTGNLRQLGSQFALKYWLDLPLNRSRIDLNPESKNGYRHWIGLGLGVGYTTRIWDLETNHQSAVLGSQINASLNLQYAMRLFDFNRGEVRFGLRISHFSNGAFQLPNLGTNNAALFLAYHFRSTEGQNLIPQEIIIPEKHRFTIAASGGLKEIPPPTGKKFGVGVLSLLAEKRISYKSSFGIGTDVFYNSSLHELMERKEEGKVNKSMALQNGWLVSYTMHFDDFELKMQQGVYVLDHWKVDGTFYHRFGLRYRINEHVFASVMLKTHFAKADYGEFGMGYAF